MARIAIDARRLRSSTGRYARELLDELEKIPTKHEYHVIIHELDQGVWAPSAPNVAMHVVPWDHYTFGEQLGFARFLYKLKPDLIHFTMPQQPLLYFGKRVTTIHDLTLVRYKNIDKNRFVYAIEQTIFKFLLKNVARRSIMIITPSRFVARDVVEYCKVSEVKVRAVYEAASGLVRQGRKDLGFRMSDVGDKEDEEVRRGRKDEEVRMERKDLGYRMLDVGKDGYIFYVGNAYPHKNLNRLVDAHRILKDKYPGLKLVIAGKREYFHEQLLEYVTEQKQEGVLHLGWVDDEQLAWLYRHTKAYVFPSLSEGFGLPGLEAMAHGAPVVSSNATCLPEIYGEAAHYFDPTSAEDMARAIDEVLRSKTRREALLKAAGVQLERYSWAKTAEKTYDIYAKIVS